MGFPHSDIHGSKPALGSPWLNAECHVLHRLSVPRHPRNALLTLDRFLHRDKPDRKRIKQRMCSKLCKLLYRQLFAAVRALAGRTPPCPWPPPQWRLQQSRYAILLPGHNLRQIRKNLFTMTKSHATNAAFGLRLIDGKESSSRIMFWRCHGDAPGTRWWSQTGSNRRPQACKASALPTELWPQRLVRWWAREDLNLRPHAYQACALTS